MRTEDGVVGRFEFGFPSIDTLLLVEVEEGEVTIRATRDTFSPRRKDHFIRELVSEGFIPEEFRWSAVGEPQALHGGVRWLVDFSWAGIDHAVVARTRRQVVGFLASAFLFAVLLVGLAATGHLGNKLPVPAAVRLHDAR